MGLLDKARNNDPNERPRSFGTKNDQPNDSFEGMLVEVFYTDRTYKKPGRPDQQLNWSVREPNGKMVTVWGGRGWLETGMQRSGAEPNDYVAGVYHGLEKNPKPGQNAAHQYTVLAEKKSKPETNGDDQPASQAKASVPF